MKFIWEPKYIRNWMPPSLRAESIMFSGCLSVRPSVCLPIHYCGYCDNLRTIEWMLTKVGWRMYEQPRMKWLDFLWKRSKFKGHRVVKVLKMKYLVTAMVGKALKQFKPNFNMYEHAGMNWLNLGFKRSKVTGHKSVTKSRKYLILLCSLNKIWTNICWPDLAQVCKTTKEIKWQAFGSVRSDMLKVTGSLINEFTCRRRDIRAQSYLSCLCLLFVWYQQCLQLFFRRVNVMTLLANDLHYQRVGGVFKLWIMYFFSYNTLPFIVWNQWKLKDFLF